ncbi:Protein kinase domain [Carpediemonas membranifera]|uniref:non-specific serine/threonine protein kinase n=1 Tax=Carpediemonas membranifera TaxID=201153 RepID=A0A8J6E524_9EUKA|nr:Protein kinase domain [Carpediemonas membranifera]|eukprot:KAG9397661.1 Protein kinase domain [Carpediemonas membranifera]
MPGIDASTLITSNEDPSTLFQLLDQIGEGSYGAVYKAISKQTGTVVAIKVIAIDGDWDEVNKEIQMLKELEACDQVIRYHGSWFLEPDLWIVMELCQDSMSGMVEALGHGLDEQQISFVMRETLLGLQFLHSNRKIHRDIKSGNILFKDDGSVKLADFGVSAQLANTISKRKTMIGSPFWMAPEVVQGLEYGTVADVWSVGITAIELADTLPPRSDVHPMRLIFQIPVLPSPTLAQPEDWSDEFNDFIAKCLDKDPQARPSCAMLLQHPFIKAAPSKDVMVDAVEELIAIKATAPDNEFDDGTGFFTTTDAGSTMASGTMMAAATMPFDAGTVVPGFDDADGFGTVMIPSGAAPANNAEDSKPAFLRHMEREETKDKGKADVDVLMQKLDDIRSNIAMLQKEEQSVLREISANQ